LVASHERHGEQAGLLSSPQPPLHRREHDKSLAMGDWQSIEQSGQDRA